MIQLEFEYDKKSGYFNIKPKDKKYIDLCLISNWNWHSDYVQECIDWTEQCKAGTFQLEDGEDWFHVGFENSPGIISVLNNDRAYLEPQYEEREDYLILSHEELLEILHQMSDYLKGIGK